MYNICYTQKHIKRYILSELTDKDYSLNIENIEFACMKFNLKVHVFPFDGINSVNNYIKTV